MSLKKIFIAIMLVINDAKIPMSSMTSETFNDSSIFDSMIYPPFLVLGFGRCLYLKDKEIQRSCQDYFKKERWVEWQKQK